MRALVLVAALAVVAGCNKDDKKAEPPSADPNAAATAQVQAGSGGVQAQAGGNQVNAGAGGAQVQVQGAGGAVPTLHAQQPTADGKPIVMQNSASGNKLTIQPNGTVEGKTADGRKVTAQAGGAVVAEDPSRPGTKVQIQGDKVIVPGVGTVQAPPH